MGKIDTNIVTKTVAEHLVDFLERRDVKHVFGLCGHTNIAVLAAMAESPLILQLSGMNKSPAMRQMVMHVSLDAHP